MGLHYKLTINEYVLCWLIAEFSAFGQHPPLAPLNAEKWLIGSGFEFQHIKKPLYVNKHIFIYEYNIWFLLSFNLKDTQFFPRHLQNRTIQNA